MITTHLQELFGLGWVNTLISYCIITTVVIGFLILMIIRKRNLILRIILSFTIIVILFLSLKNNPIYRTDFQVGGLEGTKPDLENVFVDSLLNLFPNYSGLVLLSITNCSYCSDAKEKLSILKRHQPLANILVVVFDENLQTKSENMFLNTYTLDGLDCIMSSGIDSVTPINKGGFPFYLYFENGELIKKWENEAFGLASLDWVEKQN